MLIMLFLYLAVFVWLSVKMTKAMINAWKGEGWRKRIIYTGGTAYFWYRTIMLAVLLWDIIM